MGLAMRGAALFGLTNAQLVVDHERVILETFRQNLSAPFAAQQEAKSSPKVEVPDTLIKTNKGICDPKGTSHSGYIKFDSQVVVPSQKAYFFWLFEAREKPETAPLVVWLTGGPGCSSQMALLIENGPCNVANDGSVATNPWSWTNKANVMWVDQPAGTGFSKGMPTDHDQEGVAQDFYAFLENFFEQMPAYKGRPFYITGESYAGHYVPGISHYIWQQNKGKVGLLGEKINLKGIAIGNGLTSPEKQYPLYPQMALDGGKSEGGSLEQGVITNPAGQAFMKAGAQACKIAAAQCNENNELQPCVTAFIGCNYAETVPYQMTGYNPYDMRIKCEKPPLCYDMSGPEKFLNDADIQSKIGAQGEWASCNMAVNKFFMGDWMRNYDQLIPDMLHDGIDVLIYAGDVDYICNWLGNKAWVLDLDWRGKKEFVAAEDNIYVKKGSKTAFGRVRSFENFHFAQIYNAGHMVPMDQPEAASQMLNDFLFKSLGKNTVSPAEYDATLDKKDETAIFQ